MMQAANSRQSNSLASGIMNANGWEVFAEKRFHLDPLSAGILSDTVNGRDAATIAEKRGLSTDMVTARLTQIRERVGHVIGEPLTNDLLLVVALQRLRLEDLSTRLAQMQSESRVPHGQIALPPNVMPI